MGFFGGVVTTHSINIEVADDRIKTLPTDALEVLSAVSGIVLIPQLVYGNLSIVGGYSDLTGGGVQYGGTGLLLVWGNDDSDASTYVDPAIFSAGALQPKQFLMSSSLISVSGQVCLTDGDSNGDFADKEIRLLLRNSSINLTGGNSSNVLNLAIVYLKFDTTTGEFI